MNLKISHKERSWLIRSTKQLRISKCHSPSNSRYRSIKTIPKKSENSHTQVTKTSMRVSPVFNSPSVEKVSRKYLSNSTKKILFESEEDGNLQSKKNRANSCVLSEESRKNLMFALKFEKITNTFKNFKAKYEDTFNKEEMMGRLMSSKLPARHQTKELSDLEKSKIGLDLPSFHYALGLISATLKIKQKRHLGWGFTKLKPSVEEPIKFGK
jgi:hypothetical protein